MDDTNSFLDLLNKPDDPRILIQALSAADQNAFRVPSTSLEPLEPLVDKREGEKGEYDDEELEEEEDSDEESTEFQALISRAQAFVSDLTTAGPTQVWDPDLDLEEEDDDFDTELRRTTGIGLRRARKRGRGRGRAARPELMLSPDLKAALGQANMHYVRQEYGEAVEIYQEVIRKNPNVHQAWVNLGLIQEELGNPAKALQLSLVAAHLRPKDGDAWKRLARMSTEQGAIRQAIYCYSKAIQADPTDVDAIWDRSYLHKEIKKYNLAISGFTKLLELAPHHTKVIDELAKIYRETGQPERAIPLYEAAMEHHFALPAATASSGESTFGYTELNILAELLMMQGDHARALEVVKGGIRCLQGRTMETWWDQWDDEREFEDDTEAEGMGLGVDVLQERLEGKGEKWEVPMELRVKMGVCRLIMGQVDEAKSHFKYLYAQPVAAYPDLYQEVAEAFIERRLYGNALAVFEAMMEGDEAVDIEILIQVGDCHRELGNLDNAAEYYGAVIEELPDKLDVKMALAQVYEELGEEERAFELVTQVMYANREAKLRKKEAALAAATAAATATTIVTVTAASAASGSATPSGPRTRSRSRSQYVKSGPSVTSDTEQHVPATSSRPSAASLFDEEPETASTLRHRPANEKARMAAREQRAREEHELGQATQSTFEELNEVGARLDDRHWARGEKKDVFEYMRIAEGLWTVFRGTKEFYPADRMKLFTGRRTWNSYKPRKSNIDVEAEMERQVSRMVSRLRGRLKGTMSEVEDAADSEEDEAPKPKIMVPATEFRGIKFELWFEMVVKYSILLATHHRKQEAYEVLKAAAEANVFYHNEDFRIGLKLVLMACALLNHDDETVCDVARWLCSFRQFRSDGYRLYGAGLSTGVRSVSIYAGANSLKYFLRQIKAMDQIVENQSRKEKDDASGVADPEGDHVMTDADGEAVGLEKKSTGGGFRPIKPNPVLLMLYGHILHCARSYVPATGYYWRTYDCAPKDPLLSLSIGLAYIHRAMQRQTDNRHLQIVQGFTFLFKYYELRGRSQEAEYNIARAFHQLGLTHLAIPHYERVLELPSAHEVRRQQGAQVEVDEEDEDDTDLKRETAYNLATIYATSGSMGLAQILLKKWCFI